MYNHLLFFSYWVVNALVLWGFNSFFGGDVVLGNWRFSILESVIYSGFWVTFLIWSFWDFALAKGMKFDNAPTTFGYFFLVNAFSFWLVSRFSEYAGFGITGWAWVFAIGVVAHLVQRLLRKVVVGKRTV